MVFCSYAMTVFLTVILCLKTSCVKSSYITVKSNGPTTLGGTTEFFVEVFGCGTGRFEYCYEYLGNVCNVGGYHLNFTISNWQSTGNQQVTIIVERINPKYKLCAKKQIDIYITDTIMAELKSIPSDNYKVGPVALSVQIHDPSHMFKDMKYYWSFDDGTYLNDTHLGEVRHNFTENKAYNVRVQIFAYSRSKLYNGTASKEMEFDVDLDPKLLIIMMNTSSLVLPPDKTNTAYVPRGYPLVLIVTYKNPYSIVKSIDTQWSFEGSKQFMVPGNRINYNFSKDGTVVLWVTCTFKTIKENPDINLPLQKRVVVEEPITDLKFENKSFVITNKYFVFNILCQGSGPFKMCWKVYKTSGQGNPLMANCTVALSQTCQFHLNHTISHAGSFTLRITVLNRVGSAHLVKHFVIPKPIPDHHNKGSKAVSAITPIIIIAAVFLLLILLFIARKIYTIRHRSVLETADFDFRDEDCRSVDSLNMGRCWCPPFKICRTFSRNKEVYPLLESWNTQNSGSGPHYSVIL